MDKLLFLSSLFLTAITIVTIACFDLTCMFYSILVICRNAKRYLTSGKPRMRGKKYVCDLVERLYGST